MEELALKDHALFKLDQKHIQLRSEIERTLACTGATKYFLDIIEIDFSFLLKIVVFTSIIFTSMLTTFLNISAAYLSDCLTCFIKRI